MPVREKDVRFKRRRRTVGSLRTSSAVPQSFLPKPALSYRSNICIFVIGINKDVLSVQRKSQNLLLRKILRIGRLHKVCIGRKLSESMYKPRSLKKKLTPGRHFHEDHND